MQKDQTVVDTVGGVRILAHAGVLPGGGGEHPLFRIDLVGSAPEHPVLGVRDVHTGSYRHDHRDLDDVLQAEHELAMGKVQLMCRCIWMT